jgi:hypothetical protein
MTRPKTAFALPAVLATVVLAAGCGSSGSSPGSSASGSGSDAPTTARTASGGHRNQAGFVARVDNQWFPLLAGSVWIYHGIKDGKRSRDVVTVSNETNVIDGIRCTVVKDRLFLAGSLEERTTDWYAQDKGGNVWYFGEETAELDPSGKVTSREGTWRAGRDGAVAGIYLPGTPRIGQSGRQENYKGRAEDHFQVLSLSASVRTPGASARNALLTKEWTPLEPNVLDHKFYVSGIGNVKEQSVKGPLERNILVSFRGP